MLYFKVIDGDIIDVFTENINRQYVSIDVKDMEDFYRKTSEYNDVAEEIEERISELLEYSTESNSLDTFNIKHWVSNRSFGELIDMYENNEIIKPDMQREFVWDSLKCSRLIESIVLGLPIPPLFLLEVDKNQYELIDGLQRLTTVINYVNGNPWSGKSASLKKISSKLSTKVSKEIGGRTFEKLDEKYQRIIKRSTIPLIEFKQLEPDSMSSKYLIFERINTGSEKLNSMQIRKSLAHGRFIKELYNYANLNEKFLELFTSSNIKKDQHVEAFLRIIVMSDLYYERYKTDVTGINNILNDYCEQMRHEGIDDTYFDRFEQALEIAYRIFEHVNNMFKRIETKNDKHIFAGNMNVSIMEAFVGIIINNLEEIHNDEAEIRAKYISIMSETREKALKTDEVNPFTTSTGALESIKKRFEICKTILVQ